MPLRHLLALLLALLPACSRPSVGEFLPFCKAACAPPCTDDSCGAVDCAVRLAGANGTAIDVGCGAEFDAFYACLQKDTTDNCWVDQGSPSCPGELDAVVRCVYPHKDETLCARAQAHESACSGVTLIAGTVLCSSRCNAECVLAV